ncbi:hypothetical protein ROA7023_01766 [Roseisalinus antarcticus]|uniref:Uncharacterized protein n=1 Tax=Roseisalinus antarcticus TaxID=254357 RepID=A0A1Y5SL32_9RHOB|nr:hypothetical protein ROA7023_01766 [Roseisalinus antarcticus]
MIGRRLRRLFHDRQRPPLPELPDLCGPAGICRRALPDALRCDVGLNCGCGDSRPSGWSYLDHRCDT